MWAEASADGCRPTPQCFGTDRGPAPGARRGFRHGQAYFSAVPGTHILADINGSGTVTTQDIFDFLGAYFAGGCTTN